MAFKYGICTFEKWYEIYILIVGEVIAWIFTIPTKVKLWWYTRSNERYKRRVIIMKTSSSGVKTIEVACLFKLFKMLLKLMN